MAWSLDVGFLGRLLLGTSLWHVNPRCAQVPQSPLQVPRCRRCLKRISGVGRMVPCFFLLVQQQLTNSTSSLAAQMEGYPASRRQRASSACLSTTSLSPVSPTEPADHPWQLHKRVSQDRDFLLLIRLGLANRSTSTA
ncbi:hypothetical protein F5X97DRAFT_105011 [Nemania serpens]|nr:hypothetical protein F5X97DRAFT_105011 [Nemania serpens]